MVIYKTHAHMNDFTKGGVVIGPQMALLDLRESNECIIPSSVFDKMLCAENIPVRATVEGSQFLKDLDRLVLDGVMPIYIYMAKNCHAQFRFESTNSPAGYTLAFIIKERSK